MIRRLYRSLTTTAATLALTTALAGPVTAQGVPTVDTQNIAQEIRQLQQMLQDFGIQTDLLDNALAQLDLLQQQFDQLEEMYASLTGPRSILGLAMGGDLDNLLQANFEDIPGLIRGIQADMERVKFSFPPTVRSALEPVFSDERVRKIILFGSRAIGDHDERSDFDLAISAPTIDRRGLVSFWDHIETSSTLFCISISLLENMPNALRDRVIDTGVVIYERP